MPTKKTVVSLLGVCALAVSLNAAVITISDTQLQSGFSGHVPSQIYTPNQYDPPVTGPTDGRCVQFGCATDSYPFDFSGDAVLTSITSLTIELTVLASSTQPGQPDFSDWSLYLDGIDTGITLNDFMHWDDYMSSGSPYLTARRTFSGAPLNEGLILAALADGFLTATIHDGDGIENLVCDANGCFGSAEWTYVWIPYSQYVIGPFGAPLYATLSLTGEQGEGTYPQQPTGIPEPASMLLMGSGALALLMLSRRAARR